MGHPMSSLAPADAAPVVAAADGVRSGGGSGGGGGSEGGDKGGRCRTTYLYVEDSAADVDAFEAAVLKGLADPARNIPQDYCYDDAGSGTCGLGGLDLGMRVEG